MSRGYRAAVLQLPRHAHSPRCSRQGVTATFQRRADRALHTALMFSSGTPPNAGGVNRGCNTANNTKARFIRTPHSMRLEQENLLVGIAVPAL
jgi:hypothetical protein